MAYDLVLCKTSVLPLSEDMDSLLSSSSTQLLAIRMVSMAECSPCLA